MSDFDDLRLLPYYLNSRRLSILAGLEPPPDAQVSLAQNSRARVVAMNQMGNLAERLLRTGKVPNLTEKSPSIGSEGERILGFVWGVFTFRGASQAIGREHDGKPFKNATFSGSIPLGNEMFEVQGELHNDHFYSISAPGMLSGKRRMLVAGGFQFEGPNIEAFPYIVGEVSKDFGLLSVSWSSSIRVYPSQIDQFSKIRTARVTSAEVASVRKIPEEDVKNALSEIIGEPFTSKDWGGEWSDLLTSRLTIDGLPATAAFILKGPSLPREMHPKDMGRRGDQLIRAFNEPADLVVVQHCNKIANTVVKNAEGLAYDLRRPRRYCIIDGSDTALILKAYGKLPS
ncbi:hypothetical protein [Arvimicrobium flavum]|uniref:hypothetical protein n=1 Tax=Arvimicrobium flavum TaxID=3393320 RepID=UPI00237A8309|nr:hypothetical protein [Mesorhizobium shangrilense]